MTPDTSVEQSTCVERCSSSFEEELIRNNKTHETEIGDDNAFSASDSDDSAEAGGNLTHHRFALSLSYDRNFNPLQQILPRLPGGGDRPHDREVRGEPAHHLLILRPRQLVHRRREGERVESVTQDPGGLVLLVLYLGDPVP